MSAANPKALRLTARDRMWVLILVVVGAACLWLGLHLYPSVFPEATIKFDVDRRASRQKAETVLRDQGFEITGYRHASSFVYGDTAKVFLERTLGLKAMDEAVAQTAKIWSWSHRWFRPLQKEEFRIDIAPTGETVRIVHLLPEDAPGARLSEEDARRLAEESLARLRPTGTGDLRYLGATASSLKNRTDHCFTWEQEGIDWKGGRYRHTVTIQGDRLGGYAQFVHVPEDWIRDYQRLRSKNTTTGTVDQVFFLLTVVAMLVVLFQKIRGRQLRWRFALAFGLVGAALGLLTAANGLPQDLYGYQTTESFGGFLAGRLVQALLSSLLIGVMIFVMAAAAESVYRSAYARKLSLPRTFTWQGLRTKEFFFSTLGGLVVTCFFLAYQCVFYRTASSLGAWSPAEVPYDELLNSAFPWAFLLFIGFLPSVTEEFTFRAFSIPFFTKILRSRVVAVILAAFIWGFGHSTYPNQPFYIRGLEVGLAGILIGVLMLRFNILYALVWHYTVDSFYSGYLLLRSGNLYYVLTAAAAGGILVLPFVVALISYLRTRTFTDPEGLRHAAESPPPEPVATAPELSRIEGAAAEVRRELRPFTLRGAAAPILVTIAVFLLLFGLSSKFKEPELQVRSDREGALRAATLFLAERGVDPAGFRTAVAFRGAVGPDPARYVLAHAGLTGLAATWPGRLTAQAWDVRFFKALDPEELHVLVNAASGRISGYEHRIAERDSLATIPSVEAESLAARFLVSVGLTPAGMERKEAADEARPKRTDRRFAWEAPAGDPRNVAEARYRLQATVTGDRAAGFRARLRIPEEYERARQKHTFAWAISLALLILGICGSLGLALRDAAKSHVAGGIPWRRLLPVGVAAAMLAIIGRLNAWPRALSAYMTTAPWGAYLIGFVVAVVIAVVLYFFVSWAGTALARGLHPSVGLLADPRARRRMLPGAFVALVIVPLWGGVFGLVRLLSAGIFPAAAQPPSFEAGAPLDLAIPGLGAAVGVIVSTFLLLLVVAAIARTLPSREWPGRGVRIALFAAAAVGLALIPARATGEGLLNLFRVALIILVAFGLIRWLLRDNPLAYMAGAYGLFAYRAVARLLGQPCVWARGQGVLALVLLLLPLVWVLIVGLRTAPVQRVSGESGRTL